MARGYFITFEGGEGSGKSTQIGHLQKTLVKAGHDVVLTREPGGSAGAEEIRRLLVTGAAARWSALSEALLVFAARADHVARLIEPALAAGKLVLCDRFGDSTLAYQGHVGGVDLAFLQRVQKVAAGGLVPDLTLVLDLPVELGLARAAQRGEGENRMEGKGIEFHQALRRAFQVMAAAEPKRCRLIEAQEDESTVAEKIWTQVKGLLEAQQ